MPRKIHIELAHKDVYVGRAWTCSNSKCGAVTLEYRKSRNQSCGGCGGTSFTGFVEVYKKEVPR